MSMGGVGGKAGSAPSRECPKRGMPQKMGAAGSAGKVEAMEKMARVAGEDGEGADGTKRG